MKKLFLHIICYLGLGFVSLFGISLIKMAVTGAVGVNTDLFSVLVVAPILFLGLGYALGNQALKVHLVLFFLLNINAFFVWKSSGVNSLKDMAGAYQVSYFFGFLIALFSTSLCQKNPFFSRSV